LSSPRFSVVIPTRQRADTLLYTLRTCLAQRFSSYEIVVCDNCSSVETKQTVESFKSSKIKYIRSDRPLAMSKNWELAVSHATGEYVIVIGDDDGLLPYALDEVNCLLEQLKVKALRWERVYYNWPNVPIGKHDNKIVIPLIRQNRIVKAREIIPSIANSRMGYPMLPMLYNAAIHRDLIEELRKKTGRVFGASSPDVYSGFAFAYLAKNYASIARPMSINAGSTKSNGYSMLWKPDSPVAQEFFSLNAEAMLGFHPRIPDIRALPAIIADSFQHAKDVLFPDDRSLAIDRKLLAINCVKALRPETQEEWESSLQVILASMADNIRLKKWFTSKLLESSPPAKYRGFDLAWRKGFDGSDLLLDATDFGVTDVFGVAELCEKILGSDSSSSRWVETSVLQKIFRRLYHLTPNSWREVLLQNIRALI